MCLSSLSPLPRRGHGSFQTPPQGLRDGTQPLAGVGLRATRAAGTPPPPKRERVRGMLFPDHCAPPLPLSYVLLPVNTAQRTLGSAARGLWGAAGWWRRSTFQQRDLRPHSTHSVRDRAPARACTPRAAARCRCCFALAAGGLIQFPQCVPTCPRPPCTAQQVEQDPVLSQIQFHSAGLNCLPQQRSGPSQAAQI